MILRAVDEKEIKLDVFLQKRRHKKAAIFSQLFVKVLPITTRYCWR